MYQNLLRPEVPVGSPDRTAQVETENRFLKSWGGVNVSPCVCDLTDILYQFDREYNSSVSGLDFSFACI